MPIYRDIPYIGPPRHYGGSYSEKDGLTVHCTANTASARDEASYATRRSDSVSSHYYIDDTEIIQSLNTDLRAWHAGSTWPNTYCISYEFTGHTSWSRAKWLSSVNWDAAARQMARDCRQWNIPARWVSVRELRNHTHGFNTHYDCTRAFRGTHTDPGPNFPKDHLLAKVQAVLNGDDDVSAEEVWTTDGIVKTPRVDGLGRPKSDEEMAENPHWWAGNMIRNTFEVAAIARGEQLAQHEALMAALKAHDETPGATMEELRAAARAGAQEALAAADIAVTWGPGGE